MTRVEIMEVPPDERSSKRWRLLSVIVEKPALAAGAVGPTAVQSDAVDEAMGAQA